MAKKIEGTLDEIPITSSEKISPVLESSGILDSTKMSEFDPFRHGFKQFGEETMSKAKQSEPGSFLKTNDKKMLVSSPRAPQEISHFSGASKNKSDAKLEEKLKKKPQKISLQSPSPLSQKEGFDLSEPTPKVEADETGHGQFRFDKSSSRISENQHDSSYSRADETVELEELGKSRLSEHDAFFDTV